MSQQRAVYIIDGCRTPFLKARNKPGEFAASDLLVAAGKPLLMRQKFPPTAFDEVITGCVMPSENEANISRIAALRLGCSEKTPAWTVQRNCASGLQAIDSAAERIRDGNADLVLAAGAEAMSRAPLLYPPTMGAWLGQWMSNKHAMQKIRTLMKIRPSYFVPIIALLRGLNDPVVGMSMGQTAEQLAYEFNISRDQMDAFALQSHQSVLAAQAAGYLQEVIPLYTASGKILAQDDGVRTDSSMEKLAKLKPFFDKPYGSVTAANSSQVTDGAAALILASESAVEKYQLPVLGKIIDSQWAALSPERMGLGPVYAATPLMQRQKLTMADIDYWEINEAFAAQVLACTAAWEDDVFCQQELQLPAAMGTLAQEKLNIDGGAIALGHPVGASGARIVLHLLQILKRKQAKRGIAAICIGGGQGGAMLVESIYPSRTSFPENSFAMGIN